MVMDTQTPESRITKTKAGVVDLIMIGNSGLFYFKQQERNVGWTCQRCDYRIMLRSRPKKCPLCKSTNGWVTVIKTSKKRYIQPQLLKEGGDGERFAELSDQF